MNNMIVTETFPHLQLYFTFSARLAEQLGAIAPLYYWARWSDINGQGWTIVDLESAAPILKRTIQTLRHHLYKGARLGYFYKCEKIAPNKFYLKYKSDIKLCHQLGIGLGAIASASILFLSELKFLCAEATADAIQKKSARKAHNQVSQSDSPDRISKIVDPVALLSNSSSVNSRGVVLAKGKRVTYLREDAIAIGGKLETIAQSLGRCTSTLQRRFSNNYRRARNCQVIPKTQLAIASSDIPVSCLSAYQSEINEHCDRALFLESLRYFVKPLEEGIYLFRALPSIYLCERVELIGQRNKRRTLKSLSE